MFRLLIWLVLLFSLDAGSFAESPKCSKRPNIVFMIVDDAGWNDFSFHGSPQIPTPNLDALAVNGVILNSYYASPLCTPTRGSILTGKHPIHIRLQHYAITGGIEDGLPLEEKLLPQYLKDLGYATHLVGKWHLGHAREVYTPTRRGFDTHYGNWVYTHDYYTHELEDLYFPQDPGYDFRRGMEIDYEGIGNYSTELFTNEAVKLIQNHPTENPLFLMIAHVGPHAANPKDPLQAPKENVDKFNTTIEYLPRRQYAGMVDKIDEGVGEIVEALEGAGMLDNTIFVFTSDNGGSPEGLGNNHGSNWPLRGVKNSLWEGGTRVAGFIWSNFLPQRVSMDLMHVQDWLPTLYEASGGKLSDLGKIDGVSQWNAFQQIDPPARTEFLYNIDDSYNNSAYRSGPWKIIQGNASAPSLEMGGDVGSDWDGWYGPSGRSESISVHHLIPNILNSKTGKALIRTGVEFNITQIKAIQNFANVACERPQNPTPCDSYTAPCLFDISNDPCEYNNLAAEYPDILESLLSRIERLNATALEPIRRFYHPEAAPHNWNNTWTNWKDLVESVVETIFNVNV